MSVTSLTGTTWIINETPTYSPFRYATTTHIHATIITHDTSDAEMQLRYIELRSYDTISYMTINSNRVAYANSAWSSENYRTITFASEPTSGGHAYDATTAETIEWLEANAVRVAQDVEVSLGGSFIATLNNTGSVTLATQNTYLTDDITVDYTKSGGGTPTLQSKTVTPSGYQLTVNPDTGYDGLSSVIVNPITLKMGVELPAAELVQSFTYDKLIVADEGVTLPAYTTSAITLKSSTNLTPTVTLSLTGYDYYVLARYLSTPVYNTSTIAKGREEYVFSSCAYEIVSIPLNTFVSSNGKKYASQNTTTLPVGALNKLFYWTSATALGVYNGAAYGCYQAVQTPSVSSASSLSPTFTLKSPILYIRGHSTYFPQAVWDTVTDIRYQYIIDVYRVQKNTYNLNGWGIFQQADHIIDCAFSTLT